jgi:hypothetical protein
MIIFVQKLAIFITKYNTAPPTRVIIVVNNFG